MSARLDTSSDELWTKSSVTQYLKNLKNWRSRRLLEFILVVFNCNQQQLKAAVEGTIQAIRSTGLAIKEESSCPRMSELRRQVELKMVENNRAFFKPEHLVGPGKRHWVSHSMLKGGRQWIPGHDGYKTSLYQLFIRFAWCQLQDKFEHFERLHEAQQRSTSSFSPQQTPGPAVMVSPEARLQLPSPDSSTPAQHQISNAHESMADRFSQARDTSEHTEYPNTLRLISGVLGAGDSSSSSPIVPQQLQQRYLSPPEDARLSLRDCVIRCGHVTRIKEVELLIDTSTLAVASFLDERYRVDWPELQLAMGLNDAATRATKAIYIFEGGMARRVAGPADFAGSLMKLYHELEPTRARSALPIFCATNMSDIQRIPVQDRSIHCNPKSTIVIKLAREGDRYCDIDFT